MAYEELFTDLLKAEREEDVSDALTVFGLEKFSDTNSKSHRSAQTAQGHNPGVTRNQRNQKERWAEAIEITTDEDVVTIMKDSQTTTRS